MTLIFQLRVRCPECGQMGLRIVQGEGATRLICRECKKVDAVVTERQAWECLSAVTQLATPRRVPTGWIKTLGAMLVEKLIEGE